MPSELKMAQAQRVPEFDDYHRTVIGYHGTKRSTALRIVQGLEAFVPSTNRDDWLGNGVYFWEYGPQQAWSWADRMRRVRVKANQWDDDEEIAVLGSMIRLGHCLDLLDPLNIRVLKSQVAGFRADLAVARRPFPRNVHAHRYLDCAIFEYTYAWLAEMGRPIDTCRAVYIPTSSKTRIWNGSWIYEGSHIQLCVRNPGCVLGTWLVPPAKRRYLDDD